ncbi:MAG: PIG-L family deacetylase [Deltaproteobacteria bacterium]|nr:PIG-L family deacetylase [Deltaproteobacteria bacterium]
MTARVDAGIKEDMLEGRLRWRVARVARKGKGRRRGGWVGVLLALALCGVDPLPVAAASAGGVAPIPAPAGPPLKLEVPPKLRLLVVAPHPDDESLGAGGLMQQVLEKGGRVHVLFMTSGDGYPEAVALATGHRQPTAADYRGFGELRRAEALVALEHFHILPLSVTFLGFPDGGLQEIWRRGPRVPAYESPFTHDDRPPYPEAFNPNARYTSRELIGQIAHLVALADPDWIALPTPLDTHPDHCATFTFILAALKSLAAEPGGESKIPDRLLTYLVHDSRWPPLPSIPGPLPPPPQSFPPARWYSLPLEAAQIDAKLGALESHRTQAAVMDLLFRALARSNEVFGVIERPEFGRLKPGEPACGPEIVSHSAPGTVPITVPSAPLPAPEATPVAAARGTRVPVR